MQLKVCNRWPTSSAEKFPLHAIFIGKGSTTARRLVSFIYCFYSSRTHLTVWNIVAGKGILALYLYEFLDFEFFNLLLKSFCFCFTVSLVMLKKKFYIWFILWTQKCRNNVFLYLFEYYTRVLFGVCCEGKGRKGGNHIGMRKFRN